MNESQIIEATTRWLEHLVIGERLCPFAAKPHAQGQIRYIVNKTPTLESLAQLICDEMLHLAATPISTTETTLVIEPDLLSDFIEFNDFLGVCESLLDVVQLTGVLQFASFHPDYMFEQTAPRDAANATNRAPFPTIHILREASIATASDTHPDVDSIPDRNIEHLRGMSKERLAELERHMQRPRCENRPSKSSDDD